MPKGLVVIARFFRGHPHENLAAVVPDPREIAFFSRWSRRRMKDPVVRPVCCARRPGEIRLSRFSTSRHWGSFG
jgi:hypothetical protein